MPSTCQTYYPIFGISLLKIRAMPGKHNLTGGIRNLLSEIYFLSSLLLLASPLLLPAVAILLPFTIGFIR